MASADFSPTREVPTPQVPAPTSAPQNADAAKTLRAQLERLATRRNARSLQHELSLSLAIGATICAPLLLAHRLLIIDLPAWIPVAILSLAIVIGIVRGLAKRVGTFEAALDADRVLGLDERLSSALAFAQPEEWRRARNRGANSPHKQMQTQTSTRTNTRKATRFDLRSYLSRRAVVTTANATNVANANYVSAPSSTTLVPALLSDAAARVRVLDAKKVYPSKFDLTTKLLIVAVAALLTFAIMPDSEILRSAEQRKTAVDLKKQGAELDAIAKPILKQPQLDEKSPTKKLAGKLEALARKMQRGRMGREEALLGIGQLRRDLEKAIKQNDSNSQPQKSDVQRLREALQSQQMQSGEGQQMQRELKNNDVQKAAEQLDKLADKIEKGAMSPEEKKQAAQDLKKAADALRKNGQPDAAKKMEDAAKSLEKQAAQDQKNGNAQQKQGQNGQQQNGQQQQKNGKNGQSQNGQQNAQKQNANGQKNGQQQGAQNGQKQGAQKQGQNGSQQQQGGQKQGQNSQNQNGQQQQGQNGQQGQKQGSSTQQGQQQQGGQQSQSQQGSQQGQQSGGSQALRDMANSMRQGEGQGQSPSSGNSQDLQKMLDKIKEAERNTGGNSGQQQQGQQQGQGNQPGQNSGQTMTPGKDLMPTNPNTAVGGGAGLGSRKNAQGSQSGGGVSKIKGARTGDKRRWQDVWTDRLPKTRQKIDRITGKLGDSGEMQQLPTKTEAKGGTATTPYYNVYESYKKDAEDAVAKDNVPPAYKQPVKNYFESLKP